MRILIIEDEKITADDLIACIDGLRPNYEIIKVLPSVASATKFLQTNRQLDLIFSDIQLGDGLSFEIFKKVAIKVPVIFCTAYDAYALKAFDANGIAYVLKPFSLESIENAIHKFESLTKQHNNKLGQLIQYIEQVDQKKKSAGLIVYQGEKIIPLQLSDIAVMHLKDGIVKLITFDNRRLTATETLEELDKLNHPDFYRANRQFLINRDAVKNASKYFNRRLILELTIPFKEQIIISKEKASAFLNWLVQA